MIYKLSERKKQLTEAVKSYTDRGWRVLPCHGMDATKEPLECTCHSYRRVLASRDAREFSPCEAAGKKPYLMRWQDVASDDPKQALKWWSKAAGGWLQANVGIATGQASGLFVLDVDGPDGVQDLDNLTSIHGELPPTVTVLTGSGGYHYYFRWPEGAILKNTAKKIAPHLDTRVNGGYVVAPPSMHRNGKLYRFVEGRDPNQIELADVPQWLLDLCLAEAKGTTKTSAPEKMTPNLPRTGPGRLGDQLAEKAIGFDAHLARIGDGDGQLGFDKPIFAAACSWMHRHNADESTIDELKRRLRDAIGSASRRPDRDLEVRYLTEDYLNSRIAQAVNFVREKMVDSSSENGRKKMEFDDEDELVDAINAEYAIVLIGGNARYARDAGDEIELFNKAAMTDWLAPYKLWVQSGSSRRSLRGFDVWIKSARRREYRDVVFEPGGAAPGQLNLWRDFAVKPREGDWRRLQNHIYENVCRRSLEIYEWFICWMAQMVQEPHKKLGTAIVVRGKKGTGKTKVFEHLAALFGVHAITIADAKHLVGNFNAHLAGKILVVSEEGFWAGDKSAEGTLKHLITGSKMVLERKGVDAFEISSYVRLAITSNENWVVPATDDERRFLVLDVGEERIRDHEYFAAIDEEMLNGGREAMLHDLLRFDFGRCNLRQPPQTQGLSDQVLEALSPGPAWWFDCLCEGRLIDADEPMKAVWPSSGWFEVSANVVQSSYQANVRDYGRSRASLTRLGSLLKKYAPNLTRQKVTTDSGRERNYHFPPLDDLRRQFTAQTGVTFGEQRSTVNVDDVFAAAAREIDEGLAINLFETDQERE